MKLAQSIQIERKLNLKDSTKSFFFYLYESLTEIGIYPGIQSADAKKTILLNKFTLVLCTVSFTLSVFFYFLGWRIPSIALAIQFFLNLQIFYLQYKRNFSLAKFVYFAIVNIFALCITSIFGLESGMIFLFLPIIIQVFIFFKDSEVQEKLRCGTFSILSLLFLEMTNYSILSTVSLNTILQKYLSIYSLFSVGIITVYLVGIALKLNENPEVLLSENKKLQMYLEKEVYTRQNAYESLAFSVKMQREVLNGIHGGIIIMDKNGFIHNSNQIFESMFGLSGKYALKGGNFFEEINTIYRNCSDSIPIILENINKVLDGNLGYSEMELEEIQNHKLVYISMKISEIKNASFHGVCLMHNDISELKKAKMRLDYFKFININLKTVLPDIMLNMNKDLFITDFHSDKTSSLYFPKERMVGKNLLELNLTESVILDLKKTISQVFFTGNSYTIHYNFELDSISYSYEAKFMKSDEEEIMVVLKKLEDSEVNYFI
jgi:PAS domain S-box-containing protein